MLTFEVQAGLVMRRFTSFAAATFFFVSQDKAKMIMETRHAERGPDGSYVSREVLIEKTGAPLCVLPVFPSRDA